MWAPARFAPALAVALGLPLAGQAGPGPCGVGAEHQYHCVPLRSTAAGGDASGLVELVRARSPFGIAVTAEGFPEVRLVATLEGLRPLGGDSAYVAWATTPVLDPVVPLRVVGNGRHDLGIVRFNKFLVLISIEVPPHLLGERSGPLVLRGRSPSMRMEAHDLFADAPAAERGAGQEHATHGGPPMYPGISMPAGIRGLRPGVAETLPEPVGEGAWAREELPAARAGTMVVLPNGGTLDLEAGLVRRTISGRTLVMLAFNQQHPGPLVRVPADATIFVNFTNRTPYPTAVHWHGVRLDNRFDGVPGITQEPVQPGGSFRYRIHFRDAGIYWYHPHHREDLQQELGLYGNLLVDPADPTAYGPVNREQVLMLDDLLVGPDGIVPFGESSATFAMMGRFGNTFLVNGEPEWQLVVDRGAVVRFFITNASNTRTFNVSFVDASADSLALPIKVVGSDVSRFERQEWTDHVTVAPAERYVVEAQFPAAGRWTLMNRVQAVNHRAGTHFSEVTVLGAVHVRTSSATPDYGDSFATVQDHPDVVADIQRFRSSFDREPDQELAITVQATDLPLPIEQLMQLERRYFSPVEWSGTMPLMNWVSSTSQVRWVLRDARTGLENMDISWRFRVGDVVRIRVVNDPRAFHAMQHPLHIHGQRFLVLAQDGVPNDNLAWKDTVLLPVGTTTELLLEVSNPGRWMVHCHIAEHLEAGMKFVMDVDP